MGAEDAASKVCALANDQCVVTFRKRLGRSYRCRGNCHCLSPAWEQANVALCSALGDCGPKINWDGDLGSTRSYKKYYDGVEGYLI